jgi:hypothetical protein
LRLARNRQDSEGHLTNDAAFEASEAFNLALSAITNATTLDNIGTAIIFENDAAPVSNSRISVDDIFVDESQAYADFQVRLDAPEYQCGDCQITKQT